MIFNKLQLLISFRSTAVILRNYNGSYFQPNVTSKSNILYFKKLQKQSKRLEVQAPKGIPSQVHIQVIGHGNRAGCRSVLLITDHRNYLFNCGEGTQRLSTEYHDELIKVEHIFITRPTWENIGGIPGFALTACNRGIPTLYFHGPNGSVDIMEATETFMTLEELSCEAVDTTTEFSDQTMTVTYIPIVNPKLAGDSDSVNSNLSHDNISYFNYEIDSYNKISNSSTSSQKRILKVRSSDCLSRINNMMAFACKIHQKKANLDFEKCVAIGLTPGPNLKKLQSGEDVTLEDGTIIRNKDVVTSAEIGPLFIVLECPSEDWIDVIVNNPGFLKYQLETATNQDDTVHYIIHFSPENVLKNSKYKEWMCKFGSKTQHLIVNEHNNSYTSEAVHKMQHQLNLIHPNIFPSLGDPCNDTERNSAVKNLNKTKIDVFEEKLKKSFENSDSIIEFEKPKDKNKSEISTALNNNDPIIHQCKTLDTFHLRPDIGLDKKIKVEIRPEKYIKEIIHMHGFLDVYADLKGTLNAKTKTLGELKEYPKLLMLGTGSSECSDFRNRSGMLLQLDEDRSIVLDCGEGSMGQLLTFFGQSKIDRVLKSIKAVYISHLHADHHLGFIGLIKQREKVTNEPLFLLAPQHICLYLHFYHNRFEPIIKQFRLVSNRDFLINEYTLDPVIAKDLYDLLGIENISMTFVTHCVHAYAIAITLKDGRKICYSGDSMPCDNVVKLANDSFLLIHEATMEDGCESEAEMDRHSTISQAIDIGKKANAQFTLLTHFSPTCWKIPLLPSVERGNVNLNRVGIAYDFMSVSLSELPLLSCFYPCLKHMFYKRRLRLDERNSMMRRKKDIRKNLLRALKIK